MRHEKTNSIRILIILCFGIILLANNSLASENPGLAWHTFIGTSLDDTANGAAFDTEGNTYVVGSSSSSWGIPINGHSGDEDAFIVKLNKFGEQIWHTFIGGASSDRGWGILLGSGGNIFIYGHWCPVKNQINSVGYDR